MITVSQFRVDYQEFISTDRYPPSLITYWLVVAALMLNANRFGPSAPFVATAAALVSGGANYAVNDKISLAGGTFSTPVSLAVDSVDGSGAIITSHITNVGAYTVIPPNPVGQGTTSGAGSNATFNLAFTSGPYTEMDIATELYIAHNIVLERRALDQAALCGIPGESPGILASKSVDKVSMSYDTASAIVAGAGDWNLTIYGTRFARMVNQFGMGPVTIVGRGAPYGFGPFNGTGYAGPIFSMGIDWDN